MSDVIRDLCNAVEPVPGPLPGRCALWPHADGDHDWVPGVDVLNRADLQRQALTHATNTVMDTPSDRLPVRVPGAALREAVDAQTALDAFQVEPSAENLAATREVIERWPA